MIEVTNTLWVGNSTDAAERDLKQLGIYGMLNVARDLQFCGRRNGSLEYMQVGLVDGPGNTMAAYHAAVVALADLCSRSKVLVYDHNGGRAMVVALMYVNIAGNRSWDDWMAMAEERDIPMPAVHEVHKAAFGAMKWKNLREIIG